MEQQLGLIEIRPRPFLEQERRDWSGRGWLTGGARLTPWGTAVTWAFLEDEMRFTFDYGDNWQFEVRLEKVEAEPCRLRRPEVVESAGKAPEQYPQSEW